MIATKQKKKNSFGLIQAIRDYLSGYTDFSGQTNRTSYLWILFLKSLFALLFFIYIFIDTDRFIADTVTLTITLATLFVLFFLPSFALIFRRLRDIGLTGLTIAGLYLLDLVFNLKKSTGTTHYLQTILHSEIPVFKENSMPFVLNILIVCLFFYASLLPTDTLATTCNNPLLLLFFRKKRS